MATAKTALPLSHGKLHKRTTSDPSASLHNPPAMPFIAVAQPRPSLDRERKRKVTYDEMPDDPSSVASSVKMRPYFRKTSGKDSAAIDLSRPAAENEALAGLGLGISDAFTNKIVSDVSFVPVGNYQKSRHMRSPSNNSQFSTATGSSFQRPNAPYAHPMRQTPRPYTPPISRSYATSLGGRSSDEFDEPQLPDDELTFRRLMTASNDRQARRSGSVSSVPNITAPPPLHLNTSDSLTRFTSPSQTSLPSMKSRPRGATLQSVDTMSPSSRPSMDKPLGFLRSQRSAASESDFIDPLEARAANIRAARQKYQEREDAKLRKFEKEELKQQERRNKRDERKRRKSDAEQARRGRSTSTSNLDEKMTTREAVGGREYTSLRAGSSGTLPTVVDSLNPRDHSRSEWQPRGGKRSAKTKWVGFWAWFRTRLLRLGRKMGMRK